MLQEFFDGKLLNTCINPDEAVALGATIHAAKILGKIDEGLDEIVLIDINPLSLGIATADEIPGQDDDIAEKGKENEAVNESDIIDIAGLLEMLLKNS